MVFDSNEHPDASFFFRSSLYTNKIFTSEALIFLVFTKFEKFSNALKFAFVER